MQREMNSEKFDFDADAKQVDGLADCDFAMNYGNTGKLVPGKKGLRQGPGVGAQARRVDEVDSAFACVYDKGFQRGISPRLRSENEGIADYARPPAMASVYEHVHSGKSDTAANDRQQRGVRLRQVEFDSASDSGSQSVVVADALDFDG